VNVGEGETLIGRAVIDEGEAGCRGGLTHFGLGLRSASG
jgi:hypothetical protein